MCYILKLLFHFETCVYEESLRGQRSRLQGLGV